MKFIIIGYRDAYFWNEYGTSVRDLQIAEILSRKYHVTFINRPVSIYERLKNKKKVKSEYKAYSNRITFIDHTSYDLIGPLFGRIWTKYCYKKILNRISSLFTDDSIIIDFTPIAELEFKNNKRITYWYDLIDNFSIHNRFSEKEKKAVRDKYAYVDENADIITAVSDKAIKNFLNPNKYVMPNGVYLENQNHECFIDGTPNKVYQLGFVGFVTDKLDIDFLNKLSKKFSIIIWGKFFDDSIRDKLNENIKIAGAFKYSDLPSIMKSFKVGLLPYLPEKSHDESPLKMYEYFKYGIPCLSSMNFEIKSRWFVNYLEYSKRDLLYEKINELIVSNNSESIKASIQKEWLFEIKVNKIIEDIIRRKECGKKNS
ncbi:glycosyl transferase [Escherichia coli]|uniref:glycosyl transferase n=1 Tax=Escherichia coli TaxID=562 RepID=UPI001658D745|nr:glycosyl transferase [Escherichia coli]MBC9258254.1 glycosyl transferase [Escherichia coli]